MHETMSSGHRDGRTHVSAASVAGWRACRHHRPDLAPLLPRRLSRCIWSTSRRAAAYDVRGLCRAVRRGRSSAVRQCGECTWARGVTASVHSGNLRWLCHISKTRFDWLLARYRRVCGLGWHGALRALTVNHDRYRVRPTEHGQDSLQNRRLSDLRTLGRSFQDSQAVRVGWR